jgi:hypothetical protein
MRDGKLVKTGKQIMLFRIYDGWGVSTEVLKRYRPTHIQLYMEGEAYQASIDKFRQNGIRYNDSGDEQIILPRKHWEYKNLNQTQLIKED